MGTVSDKLTYLNGTKTALKDSINLMGVNITNDTFRSYANKVKDGLLDIINNGTDTVWNNWEKVTATNVTEATLQNTVEAPMKIDIKGDTQQTQLTGKNLLNIKDYINSSSNGLYFTYNNDGSFSVSGTPSTGWSAVRNATNEVIEAGTYTFSIKQALPFRIYIGLTYEDDSTQNIIIASGDTSKTFTATQKIKKYSVILSNITTGTQYDETVFAQLESGSTATDFEQYCGRNTKSKSKVSAECSCSNRK